ncbi:MAG: hypothetical protein HYU36_25280, partial [Planctomycetes bacterium]|nr:hypothetical protein [Planctomycetota bacterium]
ICLDDEEKLLEVEFFVPPGLIGKEAFWRILQGTVGQGLFRKWVDEAPQDGKNDLPEATEPFKVSLDNQKIPDGPAGASHQAAGGLQADEARPIPA